MKMKMTVLINPHFYKMWLTDKPYIICKGGRGSFKSSTISLKLVAMLKPYIQDRERVSIICLRKNAAYLRDSCYQQISWALNVLDVAEEFEFRVNPMKIVHKITGTTFYFYGADDPLKLKSNIVGNVIAIWFEEVAEFKSAQDLDQIYPTFIRQKPKKVKKRKGKYDEVKIFHSYNPPRNPYDWVNEWVENKKEDSSFFIDHSTYLDDELGINDEQQLKLIENYRANDEDYYKWLYMGEVIGLGTNVYNLAHFHPISSIQNDDYIVNIYFAMDTGHQVSATTCSCYAITRKKNVILLDTYYYSPDGKTNKKPPSELSKDIHDFVERLQGQYDRYGYRFTMDSAEGALRNQYYNDYALWWHPVNKSKKSTMIDHVQSLLGQGRFFYLDLDSNKIFVEEHKTYQWDKKTIQSDDPKVIKVDDHTCDQFQYFVMDNLRDLGLKW